jgi:mannan endo-1,4-beta-mannosidase
MRTTNRPYKLSRSILLAALFSATALLSTPAAGRIRSQNGSFVRRSGTKLTLDGALFRYGGPNIEWLGLEGYGPHDPMGPRYPTRFKIDDAFATSAEMGARLDAELPRYAGIFA